MLYHITTRAEWEAYQQTAEVRPAAFAEEGFVHTSTADQLLATAGRIFPGQPDLIVLALDEGLLGQEVRYEDLYGAGEEFPHVYGPIPLASVGAWAPLEVDRAGAFAWPPVLPRG